MFQTEFQNNIKSQSTHFESVEILIVAYGLAIVTEAIHQFTLRKREFLFAVLCLVAGTWTGYFLDRTMVKMAFAAGISFSFLGDLAMARRLK
ncbi:MAG: hypothetical protein D6732_24750, partial [Methanobacteriota archaeon]